MSLRLPLQVVVWQLLPEANSQPLELMHLQWRSHHIWQRWYAWADGPGPPQQRQHSSPHSMRQQQLEGLRKAGVQGGMAAASP